MVILWFLWEIISELCDYTVGAVELFFMAEKYNETEILNELEGLCDIVPQELELEVHI